MPVDLSAAPPVKRTRQPRQAAGSSRVPVVDPKIAGYAETLGSVRDLIVTGLTLGGQDADAGAIALHSDAAIPVYAELAKEIEPFGKFLDSFNDVGGKWLKLAFVTAPLVLQLAANHGVKVPMGGMFNTQPPELLRAQMVAKKVQMMQASQEELRQSQAEAERLIREMSNDQENSAA